MNIHALKVKEIVTKGYINPSKLPGFDYVINPYVGCPHRCMYCYAEFMKRFSNHDEPWGTFTDVKIRSTSVRPVPLQGMHVFLSSVTDCYNPLEEKYRLTRRLLQRLSTSGAKVTLLTKSALVLRDMDILRTCPDVTVGFSLNTTQDALRRELEPGASSVSQRMQALRTLHQNGIRTWVHVSPMFPYLTDWQALLQQLQPYTDSFSFENLKLRAASLPRVLLYITHKHPQLRAAYEQIFRQNDTGYWRALRKEILTYCNEHHISAAVYFSEPGDKLS